MMDKKYINKETIEIFQDVCDKLAAEFERLAQVIQEFNDTWQSNRLPDGTPIEHDTSSLLHLFSETFRLSPKIERHFIEYQEETRGLTVEDDG